MSHHRARRVPRVSRALAGPVALLLMLGLAACGDDEDDATTGTASGTQEMAEASAGEGPTADPVEEPVEDPEGGAQDEADPIEPTPVSTECLVGTWLVDNEHLGAYFASAAQAASQGTSIPTPGGEVVVAFMDDGQYTVTYDGWTVEIIQDGMTVQVVRDGTDRGTYQATDSGALTQQDTEMGSQVTMAFPGGSHVVDGAPTSTSGEFTCEGDRLSITAEGATSILDRR